MYKEYDLGMALILKNLSFTYKFIPIEITDLS